MPLTITTYGYDDANRVEGLVHTKTDTAEIVSYRFGLDGVGNRTENTRETQLTASESAGITDYTYNPEKNRLQTAGTADFTWDLEGQVLSKGLELYTFDYDHRLHEINGASYLRFLYDGNDNRLQASRGGVITRYIYDMKGNVLAEADEFNNITRYYIHGKGLLAMVVPGTPNDSVYTYHFDALGSAAAITDEAEVVVNKYEYAGFGEVLAQEETVPQPFKYVGQYGVMHEPNGYYYMRARYYDPEVGRFVSEDPVGFKGGTMNLYEYAKNNPVNFTDPSGLCKWTGIVTSFSGGAAMHSGALIFWDLESECCNNAQVKESYVTVSGGFSFGIPISISVCSVDFEGPSTPSIDDPKGAFAAIVAVWSQQLSFTETVLGSLYSKGGLPDDYTGFDMGFYTLVGYTF